MSVTKFVGRGEELARLQEALRRVADGRRDLPGAAVLLRGRRRVGKSRLAQVFCELSGVPSVFFQARQNATPANSRADFVQAVFDSDLPGRELFSDGPVFPTWQALFRQLAMALPADGPSIVVVDELPWLLEADPTLEGTLPLVWDTMLAHKPVILVLIGSDLAVMERLDQYDRPFHQRGTAMVLSALNPAEVGEMLDLPPAEAIDAYLITGGLPLICQEWAPGTSVQTFLETALADSTSPLVVSGERLLAAEFPTHRQARTVLGAIGDGYAGWRDIRTAVSSGDDLISASSLTNALHTLESKNLVVADTPLSTHPAERNRRYRVADPYLCFYLAFLAAGLPLVERGRSDLLLAKVEHSWPAWRSDAVVPVVREALVRIASEQGWPRVQTVGGWWNRQATRTVELVGTDRADFGDILLVGAVAWHSTRPFDGDDHARLLRGFSWVPGIDPAAELVAVSRTAVTRDLPVRVIGPAELIAAWQA